MSVVIVAGPVSSGVPMGTTADHLFPRCVHHVTGSHVLDGEHHQDDAAGYGRSSHG